MVHVAHLKQFLSKAASKANPPLSIAPSELEILRVGGSGGKEVVLGDDEPIKDAFEGTASRSEGDLVLLYRLATGDAANANANSSV